MKIFISYRRSVSSDVVGRLRDVLVREFGTENVFMDVYSIDVGTDFRDAIRHAIGTIDALILVIGPRFDTDRLQDEADPLRVEIQEALVQHKLILPILHGGASVPTAASLPEPIQRLAFLNAGQLRADPDFPRDADAVIRRLRAAETAGGPPATATVPTTARSTVSTASTPASSTNAGATTRGGKRRQLMIGLGAIAVVAALGVTVTAMRRSDGATVATTALPPAEPAAAGTTVPHAQADPDTIASIAQQKAGLLKQDAVAHIQEALGSAGFPVAVDGVYGTESERAVRSFQEQAGLPVTGNVDTATFRTLIEAGAAAAAPSSSTSARSVAETTVPKRPSLLVQPARLVVAPFGPKKVGTAICGEAGVTLGNDGADVFFEALLVAGRATSLPSRQADVKTVPANGALEFARAASDGVVVRATADGTYPALTVTGAVVDSDSALAVTRLARFDHQTSPADLAKVAARLAGGQSVTEIVVKGTQLFPGGLMPDGKTREDACTTVDLVLNVRLA
jgi:Putative peptidoglycan binding domain/TIR domain